MDAQQNARDRSQLDLLEARAAAQSVYAPTSSATRPTFERPQVRDAGAEYQPAPRPEMGARPHSELDHEPDRLPSPALPRRSSWLARVIAVAVAALIVTVAVATWVAYSAPASADALSVFDTPGELDEASPFPPDYRLAGGSEIDRLRSLGSFDGWETWAALLDDDQVCLIATQQTTTAATCATREVFAETGLTLGVTGVAAAGNAAPQRDLAIEWGPDDAEVTTTDRLP